MIEELNVVPEYNSTNPVVRWVFNRRLKITGDWLFSSRDSVLLDVGCGSGELLNHLKDLRLSFKKVYAIDTIPEVERLNGKFDGCEFLRQDITSTKFHSEQFDAVTCLDVLEHIPQIDTALSEIYRLLKSGGRLIISAPTENFLYKLGRFFLKGTFSSETAPVAGKHFYNSEIVFQKTVENGFKLLDNRNLLCLFRLGLFIKE